jgi:long-chain acyl-CoA synthetase
MFDRADSDDERIISLGKLIGSEPIVDLERERFEASMKSVEPTDLASIIYTSGTTGTPKGVLLSHGNFATNVRDAPIDVSEKDLCLSFLPLCHVAERVADYVYFERGATVAYAESIDTVPRNMQEVRPTVAVGVPRFFEKVYSRVMAAMEDASPARRKIFEWAVAVGNEAAPAKLAGKPLGGALRWKYLVADALVFKKLRARLGGRMRMFISGAAPLARHLAEFFYAIGLPICEAYGLTETSPLVSANTLDKMKFGTVGRVIPNVEVKIAGDGEILVRGPNVMQGYYKMEEQSAEVMSGDWFHTGDIGELDADGYLKITDRKKDLLKTSGGKYIAPAPIENLLKRSPFISMAVVIADRRKFACALIVPDFDKLRVWAEASGLAFANNEILVGYSKTQDRIMEEVVRLCADLPRYEQIKKIAVLDREFTIEGGEITPTMKVRRRVVESRYKQQIESIYL